MFCPNCGKDCGDAKFCSDCGTKLVAKEVIPKINEPYVKCINGKNVDLNAVIQTYGTGVRKVGAYAYLVSYCKISNDEAKAILDPIYSFHGNIKIGYLDSLSANQKILSDEKKQSKAYQLTEKRAELDDSGQVYCPKCLSTSVTANQKGFGIGKAVIGAAAFGGIGLAAGNIGAKKVVCTCLKCGHQWKPGKK